MLYYWVFVFFLNLFDRKKGLILYVVLDQMCNCLIVIDGKIQGIEYSVFLSYIIGYWFGEIERDVYMKFYINF